MKACIFLFGKFVTCLSTQTLLMDLNKILWDGLESDYKKYESLPMAVYISSKAGFFIRANEKAIDLLQLNKENIFEQNIINFYINPKDREGVLRRLMSKGHCNWLENETLQFNIKINGKLKRKSLRYFAKPFFLIPEDPETFLGSISIVFEISEIERFRNLEQLMPVGVFEISGSDMEVTYRNQKFDDLLWMETDETKKIYAKDLFIDANEFKVLFDKLSSGENINNEVVRLKRLSNHSNILANLNIVPEIHANKAGEKSLLKSKGFIEDITFSSFLDAPIGLYVVMRNSQNQEVVTWANNEFSRIYGFDEKDNCKGMLVHELYDEAEVHNYHDLIKEFEKVTKNEIYLTYYPLEFTNRKFQVKHLIVHAKAIKNKSNEIIGRVGSMIDVTDNGKIQLQKEIDTDYAAFLHLYRAFVHDIQTTLYSIVRGHNSNVLIRNKVEVDVIGAFKVIRVSVNRLRNLLMVYLQTALGKQIDITETFVYNLLDIIEKLNKKLNQENYYSSSMAKAQASDIRMVLIEVRKRLNSNPDLKKLMPSREWKEINKEVSEILRFARLISLWQMIIQAEGMFADLDILNRALKPVSENEIEVKGFSVIDCLSEAKNDLSQFAKNERVNIEFKFQNQSINISGIKRNLYAAFYNVLHNAIKYTWKKPSMMESYVTVSLNVVEKMHNNVLKKYVIIIFENRGDAILPVEIKNKIFQFGYRGVIAVNSRKKGTGVGLWHTKKIIDEFKGVINIVSELIPEKGYSDQKNDFEKPFITRVTIELPIKE